MSGYVAMARVEGGRVRALAWDGPRLDAGRGDATHELVAQLRDRQPRPTLREQWTALREELGMMTFFLLDPESWR